MQVLTFCFRWSFYLFLLYSPALLSPVQASAAGLDPKVRQETKSRKGHDKHEDITILEQPLSQTAVLGQRVTFSVMAQGKKHDHFHYQWYRDGRIVGDDSPEFTISSVYATSAGTYTVTVSRGHKSVTSAPAVLTVNLPPTIKTQPLSQTQVQGSPVTFTVAASIHGGGTLSYQWVKNGVTLAGATSAKYSIAHVAASDAGTYHVLLTHTLNGTQATTLSKPAMLTINMPPVIKAQPISQTIDVGSSATFSVTATGSGVLSYQWRKGGLPLSGATKATYKLTNATAASAGSYDVVVTNTLNGTHASTTSLAAILTVKTAPTILVQPKTQMVLPPDPVTFTVSAKANKGGSLTYVWKKNGTPIPGAKFASYTVPSTEFATNTDAYSVTVSNGSQQTDSVTAYAIASVVSPTYAGDPVPVSLTRPITVLPSLHVDAVNYPNGAFRFGYDEYLKNPIWTAYVNFPVHSPYENSSADYKVDSRLAAPRVSKNDYSGLYNGGASHPDSYDRGHQVPRADVSYRYSTAAGDDATIMSNLVPQVSQFNQQTWQKLEDAIGGDQGGTKDGLTSFKGRVWVYTGSVFPETTKWWNANSSTGLRIGIPTACYKIVVHEMSPGHPEVLAVLMPNVWGLPNSNSTLAQFVTSVERIEALTGLDFFPELASIAPTLDIPTWKARVDVRGWRMPFEQVSGPNVHMIQPSWDITVDQGATVTFNGAATPSSIAAPGTKIASTTWTFGDSTPSSTGFSTSHLYTDKGTFNATFTVKDNQGSSSTITRVIRVIPAASSNTPPTITPAVLADQVTAANQAVTVKFTVNDDRTPAANIEVTATSSNTQLLPEYGMVVTNVSGEVALKLNPASGQSGTATVTVTLTDGDGSTTDRTFGLIVTAASTDVMNEGFESGSKTTYALADVSLESGAWSLDDAVIGSSNNDRFNGLKSVRMRNGKATMAFDWPKGAKAVSIYHAKYGTDPASTWELWYSTDGGATWILAGPAVVSDTTTLTQAVFTLNVTDPIRFEFRKTAGGTARFNLDDFQIRSN